MSEATATSLIRQYALYAGSNVLILAAGLVSFPITTRLLSSAEFGLLSYWESVVLVLVAVVKLGASDGAVRFYPHRGDAAALTAYTTNILLTPALLGLLLWAGVIAVALAVGLAGGLEHPAVALLALAQVLPVALGTLAFRILQAREQASVNAVLSVVWRWLTLAGTLGVLVWVLPAAAGVLAAKLAVHLLVIGGLLAWLWPSLPGSRAAFDRSQVWQGLQYGLPLALMELSNIALWFVDRFMMKWLINDFSVIGLYSIGFALASYIDQLINTALSQALTPVTTRVFATDGPAAVRAVKQRVLRPLVYICAALATGLLLVGPDFLTLLASADKAGAAPVFVVIGVFFLIKPIVWTAAEGLLLHKRSKTVFVLTLVAALGNTLANLLLLPRYGMMGAAWATGLSLVGLQLLFLAACPRELRAWPPLSVLLTAGAGLSLCLLVAHHTALFGLVQHLPRLAGATVLVGVVFGAILGLDPEMRAIGQGVRHRLQQRRQAAS